MYREYLFALIRHVAFFEQSLQLTDAHAIQHSERGHVLTIPHTYAAVEGGGSLYDRTTS